MDREKMRRQRHKKVNTGKGKKVGLFEAVSLGILAAGLTGCGGQTSKEETEETSGRNAVCYAIAPTANSQGLNMSSPLVQDTIYDTILEYGYISVVVIDGEPELAASDSSNGRYR